jgi:cellulose biosynthesis protein BcsQ
MAKIISIVNFKGGVGKTTITVNLAAALAKFHNKRVLIIDMDSNEEANKIYRAQIRKGLMWEVILSDIIKTTNEYDFILRYLRPV